MSKRNDGGEGEAGAGEASFRACSQQFSSPPPRCFLSSPHKPIAALLPRDWGGAGVLAALRQGCHVCLQGCLRPPQQHQVLADLQKQLSPLTQQTPPPKTNTAAAREPQGLTMRNRCLPETYQPWLCSSLGSPPGGRGGVWAWQRSPTQPEGPARGAAAPSLPPWSQEAVTNRNILSQPRGARAHGFQLGPCWVQCGGYS